MNDYFRKLDDYFIRDLERLSEKDCVHAIRILRQRLKDLRNQEYYLSIRVDEMPFATRISNALIKSNIETIGQVLECGWDRLPLIRGLGEKAISDLKNIIDKITAKKDKIRGLSGLDLYIALKSET